MYPMPSVRFGVHKPIDKSSIINEAALNADFSATQAERRAAGQALAGQLKSRFGLLVFPAIPKASNDICLNVMGVSKDDAAPVKARLTEMGLQTPDGKFSYQLPGSPAFEVTVVVSSPIRPQG